MGLFLWNTQVKFAGQKGLGTLLHCILTRLLVLRAMAPAAARMRRLPKIRIRQLTPARVLPNEFSTAPGTALDDVWTVKEIGHLRTIHSVS
jgi:hypothetical protein